MTLWRRLIERTHGWDPLKYVPLCVVLGGEKAVVTGCVRRDRLEILSQFSDVFDIDDRQIVFKKELDNKYKRSKAFHHVLLTLKKKGFFPLWQDEMYGARQEFSASPFFLYNRGVGTFFGLSQYATHMNGFVRNEKGAVSHLWIAKRSATKRKWPGKFDTIVGGGLPVNSTALENMIKESYEEAGLAEDLVANRVIPTGCITYLLDGSNGLLYNNMFVYDLELPRDIQPQNKDNEVEFFELLKVEEVVHELLETPAETWKPDICLVLLDFFIRHGILTPDNFTDYEKLVRALSSTSAMSPYEHPMYRRLA